MSLFNGRRPDGEVSTAGTVAALMSPPARPSSTDPTAANRQAASSQSPKRGSDSADEAVVVIGKGTAVTGEIRDCKQLDIKGSFEGAIGASTIVVHPGGSVRGSVHADNAVVFGRIEGEIKINELLDVRSNAVIDGELSYGSLAVETGGQIIGSMATPSAQQQPVQEKQASPVSIAEWSGRPEKSTQPNGAPRQFEALN